MELSFQPHKLGAILPLPSVNVHGDVLKPSELI